MQSGGIIRWRHLSPCQSTNRSRPPDTQRAVVGSQPQQHSLCVYMPVATAVKYSRLIQICASIWTATLAGINVRHADALSRAWPTCSDTRAAAGLKPFLCATYVTVRSGGRRNLDRHKRTMRCGAPPQPGPSAPKRRRIASLNEDPLSPPPVEHAVDDELSSDLQDFVQENWAAIRTHVVQRTHPDTVQSPIDVTRHA